MDKNVLKNILLAQKKPLSQEVRAKLKYLTDDDFAEDQEDDFSFTGNENLFKDSFIKSASDDKISPDYRAQNRRGKVLSMAEKIAALRGITVPADYWNYEHNRQK